MTAKPSYSQSIITKFHGPTNHNGSRVTARCQARRITIPWDHALNPPENHAKACEALVDLMEWGGDWVGGALPDGTGYAWVVR